MTAAESATIVQTFTLRGVEAVPVRVEVDLLRRLPSVAIVGLSALAVKETTERVRSAIEATTRDGGLCEFPRKRVVVNVAPVELPKSSGMDLPIAVAMLVANGDIMVPDGWRFVGELSLAGMVRKTRGALAMAYAVAADGGVLVLDLETAQAIVDFDAALALHIRGVRTLGEIVSAMSASTARGAALRLLVPEFSEPVRSTVDFAELPKVAEPGIRALAIGAAFKIPVALVGAPGCGKTALARRVPSILPREWSDARTVATIYDAVGLGIMQGVTPFRAPHYSVSMSGLIGDVQGRPGECTLAHRGVMFLDEADEFPRHVLQTVRSAYNEDSITMTRASGSYSAPAAFTLIYGTCSRSPRLVSHLADYAPGIVVDLPEPTIWARKVLNMVPWAGDGSVSGASDTARPSAYWLEAVERMRSEVSIGGRTRLQMVTDGMAICEPTWTPEQCEAEAKRLLGVTS